MPFRHFVKILIFRAMASWLAVSLLWPSYRGYAQTEPTGQSSDSESQNGQQNQDDEPDSSSVGSSADAPQGRGDAPPSRRGAAGGRRRAGPASTRGSRAEVKTPEEYRFTTDQNLRLLGSLLPCSNTPIPRLDEPGAFSCDATGNNASSALGGAGQPRPLLPAGVASGHGGAVAGSWLSVTPPPARKFCLWLAEASVQRRVFEAFQRPGNCLLTGQDSCSPAQVEMARHQILGLLTRGPAFELVGTDYSGHLARPAFYVHYFHDGQAELIVRPMNLSTFNLTKENLTQFIVGGMQQNLLNYRSFVPLSEDQQSLWLRLASGYSHFSVPLQLMPLVSLVAVDHVVSAVMSIFAQSPDAIIMGQGVFGGVSKMLFRLAYRRYLNLPEGAALQRRLLAAYVRVMSLGRVGDQYLLGVPEIPALRASLDHLRNILRTNGITESDPFVTGLGTMLTRLEELGAASQRGESIEATALDQILAEVGRLTREFTVTRVTLGDSITAGHALAPVITELQDLVSKTQRGETRTLIRDFFQLMETSHPSQVRGLMGANPLIRWGLGALGFGVGLSIAFGMAPEPASEALNAWMVGGQLERFYGVVGLLSGILHQFEVCSSGDIHGCANRDLASQLIVQAVSTARQFQPETVTIPSSGDGTSQRTRSVFRLTVSPPSSAVVNAAAETQARQQQAARDRLAFLAQELVSRNGLEVVDMNRAGIQSESAASLSTTLARGVFPIPAPDIQAYVKALRSLNAPFCENFSLANVGVLNGGHGGRPTAGFRDVGVRSMRPEDVARREMTAGTSASRSGQ